MFCRYDCVEIRYDEQEGVQWFARLKIFIVHPVEDKVIACVVETYEDHYRKGKGIIKKAHKSLSSRACEDPEYEILNCTAVVELSGVLDVISKEDILRRVLLMPDFSSSCNGVWTRYIVDRFDQLSRRSMEVEEELLEPLDEC